MFNRRLPLHGLLAVLLALMAQLGVGASVPQADPAAILAGAGAICHTTSDAGGTPDRAPTHSSDCLICPLCVIAHAPSATLVPQTSMVMPSAVAVVLRNELPPPSTAPPSAHRPPIQPRAPPIDT